MNKEIKLFLSSTFDEKMQSERDYFRNEINARLNQIVGEIGANLFLYDYELGISKDEIFSNVLDTCFQKIDESDYFIGIVGDYYGTYINDSLKENYTGKFKGLVDKGIQGNLSVLELEFIKSLENQNQKKFFFIHDAIREDNAEVQSLITRIKTCITPNVNIFKYSKYENISFELIQYFENEIKNKIDSTLTPEQKNRNLVYANKTRYYVPNTSTKTILDELDSYLNNDSHKIFVLSGKAGSGKRTILLQWVQKNISNTTSKVISAFAGVEGNSISDILLDIYKQGLDKDKSPVNQEEKDEKSLLNRFAQFTLEVSQQFPKTIIIIDGINQLEYTNDWKDKYWWLNKQLEKNVKVIISTTENIDESYFEVHTILPHNSLELIENYLYKEGKEQMFNDFQEKLVFGESNNIPVFPRLLSTEICMTAKYDTIDKILDEYKRFSVGKEPDLLNLHKKFIGRLEKRETLNKNALSEICRYLYYSGNGLSVDTLKLLLKGYEKQVDTFDSLLYNELIRDINGRIKFSTIYFIQAVKEQYIDATDKKKEAECRNAIINVLENCTTAKKKENLAERAYQIYQMSDKQKMYELLSDIDNADVLYQMNQIRFIEYLNLIDDKDTLYRIDNNENLSDKQIRFLSLYYQEISDFDKSIEYNKLLISKKSYKTQPLERAKLYNNLACVLDDNENYSESLAWYKKTISLYDKYGTDLDIATINNNMSRVYEHQGEYAQSIEKLTKALEIRKKALVETHPDTATLYNNMATVYFHQGDYKRAEELFKQSLKISQKVLGFEHPDTLASYNNMAEVYDEQGLYQESLKCYEKIKPVYIKLMGEEHPNVATVYNNIAKVYDNAGNYSEAVKYYQKAISIFENKLGTEHSDTTISYNGIAKVYNHQSNYKEALKYYQKALSIFKKIGKEHPNTATAYNNMARVYANQGHYSEALKYDEQALAIRKKVLGENHPDTIVSYNNIGRIYEYQGLYDDALKCYSKALSFAEILGKKHPNTAIVYNNLARIYDLNGEYSESLTMYQKAMVIFEDVLGKKHPHIATVYNNIALVYNQQGDYPKAIEYYKQAINIAEKVLGTEHPDVANTYNNLAVVYNNQGNYLEALNWYIKALVIQEKTLGSGHPNTALSYNNIATIYANQGKYEEALNWYYKALQIQENVLGKEHIDVITTYNNLATVYANINEFSQASKWFAKILSAQDKLGKEHPLIATTYNNMGMTFFNQDNYTEALIYFMKALEFRKKKLGEEHPAIATEYSNIAAVYDNQGNYQEALDYYKKALIIAEKTLGKEHPNTVTLHRNIAKVNGLLDNDVDTLKI